MQLISDLPLTESDYIGFNYNDNLENIKITPVSETCHSETYYFVDVSLNHNVICLMKRVLDAGHSIIHIDHHRDQDFMDNKATDDEKAIMDRVTKFWDINESASMLCWIYVNIPADMRIDPSKIKYDFCMDPNFEYSELKVEGTALPISIPPALRYVNDNDVNHCIFKETENFEGGMKLLKEKNPWDAVWKKLLRYDNRLLVEIMRKGEIEIQTENMIAEAIKHNAFDHEFEIDGEKYIVSCLNTPYGNKRMFGDLYYNHDGVCKYSYDGQKGKWIYTFYSNCDNNPHALPCFKLAQQLDENGGGHYGAAGCSSESCIF